MRIPEPHTLNPDVKIYNMYVHMYKMAQARQRQHVGVQLWRSFARLWEGFECIAASRYLSHLSTYIVFTTAIASLMYFEKSMVCAPATLWEQLAHTELLPKLCGRTSQGFMMSRTGT